MNDTDKESHFWGNYIAQHETHQVRSSLEKC
jgi:hypothetical protein